ncbi:hypothetical protein O3M35_012739 [Rhynocoris fuscipes]|uniref:Uncharacterized protein n=1 Tax=Rhynocoris fuscipes TaxID=488301 RepID=A0AAW1CZU5_9HEMI
MSVPISHEAVFGLMELGYFGPHICIFALNINKTIVITSIEAAVIPSNDDIPTYRMLVARPVSDFIHSQWQLRGEPVSY